MVAVQERARQGPGRDVLFRQRGHDQEFAGQAKRLESESCRRPRPGNPGVAGRSREPGGVALGRAGHQRQPAGLGTNPARLARFTNAWTALPVKPWRWPGPDQALWTRDGLLAWTMVNDRPGSPVTDASTYSIFVAARSSQDLIQVDDAGIAWDWDSRNEL